MAEQEGRLIRAFAGGRTVRVVIAEVRSAAERARQAHALGPDAARMAAQGAVAAALLSAHIKGDERILLQVQAQRPRFSLLGEIGADGSFRARLTPSDLHLPAADRVDGILLAIKSNAARELYRGHTAITDKTLEQALSGHLEQSAQVDDIVRIGVRVRDNGEIAFAGGFLVERLPEDERYPSIDHDAFRERYGALATDAVDDVFTEMAFGKLAGGDLEILEVRPVRWACRCGREKVEATIGSLGTSVLDELLEDGFADVTCDFCNTTWHIGADRLRELRALYEES